MLPCVILILAKDIRDALEELHRRVLTREGILVH